MKLRLLKYYLCQKPIIIYRANIKKMKKIELKRFIHYNIDIIYKVFILCIILKLFIKT